MQVVERLVDIGVEMHPPFLSMFAHMDGKIKFKKYTASWLM